MNNRSFPRAEYVAWSLGAVVVLTVAGAAYSYVGWLGIGLVGLAGLLISTRLSLHGGHAVADSGFGSGAVGMYAKQIKESRSHTSPEARMAADEERAKRSKTLFLINTAFIGMIALGFGGFFLHQV